MDYVGPAIEGVLVVLLIAALLYGMRLDRKLNALRQTQSGFAEAVRTLDQAAARAETGLDMLRRAAEDTQDGLQGRIVKARELKAELESLVARAERAGASTSTPAPQATSSPVRCRKLELGAVGAKPRGLLRAGRRREAPLVLTESLGKARRRISRQKRPCRRPHSAAAVDGALAPLRRARPRRRPVRQPADRLRPRPPYLWSPLMSRLPRLLPLVAVAVGGVLALKIVSGLDGAPAFLKQAAAFAEDAAPGEKVKKPVKKTDAKPAAAKGDATKAVPPPPPDVLGTPSGQIASAPDAASAATPAAGSVPIAPICAPSAAELAKEAGLSPAELRVLQSLQSRRGELDARSQAMDTQMAVLAAAEAKVDAKIKSLGGLKDQLTGMIGQADAKTDAEVTRLVTVYSKMKPDAAAVMTQLDDKVRVPVAAKMKERALAAILGKMAPAEAKKLTEKLAARYATNGMAEKVASPEAQPAAALAEPATAPAKAPVHRRTPRAKPKAKPAKKSDDGDDGRNRDASADQARRRRAETRRAKTRQRPADGQGQLHHPARRELNKP